VPVDKIAYPTSMIWVPNFIFVSLEVQRWVYDVLATRLDVSHLVLYVQQVVPSNIQTIKLHNPPSVLQNKWVSIKEMNLCFSWERLNLPKELPEKRTTSMSNTD
jgi:hypothetical protein